MNDSPSPSLPKRRSRGRSWLRYGGIALLIGIAGLFIARRQLGNLLAHKLDARLSAAGVYLTWDSADWTPGAGIEMGGLALYRDAAKQERLALLSEVTLIKVNPEWDRWDMLDLQTDGGELVLGRGAGETKFENLDLLVKIEPGKVALTEFRADVRGLRIEANGVYPYVPAADRTTPPGSGLFSSVNLDWLEPVKEWVAFQPGKTGPVLKMEFLPQPDGTGLDLAATLNGTNFQWRGQKWDSVQATAKTTLADKPSPVVIDHLHVGHDGRAGLLTGSYDPVKKVIRIAKLDSGIDALALTRALAPDAVMSLKSFTTRGNWHLTGGGEFQLGKPADNQWNGRATLDGELVYASEETSIPFQKPAFDLRLEERVVSFTEVKAGLWEGTLDMPVFRIHLPSGKTKSRFEARFAVENARLEAARGSFRPREKQPGTLRFNWQGGGGFARDALTGAGSLSIREAEFYRVPLLGPLNIVFGQLAPGFARDVATSLTSRHRVAGGTLFIEEMAMESTLTRVDAQGSIDLARQYAKLTAKAKLRGIPGLATFLLSSLLEMEGEGPVTDVRWKLDHLPGDGGVIDGAGGVLKDAGKAAKDILSLPGKLLPRK
ncbi:MAG: hypothetical protein V4689_21820 [Verrucomicrobiota bacterium]